MIPGHVGIPGNELANKLAKEASQKLVSSDKVIPFVDFKAAISDLCLQHWQAHWDNIQCNKLKSVKKSVHPWTQNFCSTRREEIVLTRLRIGHCYETHSHLLKRQEPPRCPQCNCIQSVKHVLIECPQHSFLRAKYLNPCNSLNLTLKSLLGNSASARISEVCKFLHLVKFKVAYCGHHCI